jgi:cell wall-associated NlpC family hydrolase
MLLLSGGATSACMPNLPSGSPTGMPAAAPTMSAPAGGWHPIGTFDAEQVGFAATITTVGAQMGVPIRGWIIAVATALQESDLRNPAGGPDDSIGLFQQRPSQGWGTPEQLHDPAYAAGKFYTKLLTVAGWQQMPLTDAAQAVQRSAFPDAYAQWEPDATRIVSTLAGISDPAALAAACDPTEILTPPSGFTLPPDTLPAVTAAIMWAFAQLGTPYHLNGDCTAAHSGDPARQCDCSSLVQQAYEAAGVKLPRTSSAQFHAGTPVADLGQLRPGDLVFVPGADGTMDAPGHVGIYLGSGLIIDAPHTGDVVHIGPLQPYWTSNLAGIRRVG